MSKVDLSVHVSSLDSGTIYSCLPSLKDPKQRTKHCQQTPMTNEPHAQNTASPGNNKEAQPPSSTETANDEVRRQFEETIADEEDQEGDVVAIAREFQVDVHICNESRGDVGAVEKGEAEDNAEHGEDAEVDFPSVIR